jgi:3-oxoacyl-[acyl-carrier protein] reductase
MDLGLKGRSAVVGGASAGLGFAIASGLAAEGCRLLVWSRDSERIERAANQLRREHGAEVFATTADATEPEAAAKVSEEAAVRLGQVDIVVLNTGGPPTVDAAQTDPAAWQSALQAHTLTPIALASALLPGMRERRWGRIVAVLSSVIRQPDSALAYSTSSRLALAGWLKTLAADVAADGVTVNGVMPGRIATARTEALDRQGAESAGRTVEDQRAQRERTIPARRYGTPEEFASVAVFLCSEPARYVTGALIPVDGGLLGYV